MPAEGPPVHFLNMDYLFRILYETVVGVRAPGVQMDLWAMLAQFWLIVSSISFLISAGLLALFIYAFLRYKQVIAEDEPKYRTIHDVHEAVEEVEHSRWKHVKELIESPHVNDWRQAIIEADIILYDALEHDGYVGESVGEKLKQVSAGRISSVQEAWEAHKVRNEIAHQGSAFELTDTLAYRTIQRYETVLREFGEIT
ncbi:MAG: hypothetical protein AAB921_02135 [Patescibacteria group bacterium]